MGSGLCKTTNNSIEAKGDSQSNSADGETGGENDLQINLVPEPPIPNGEVKLIKGIVGGRRFGFTIKVPKSKKKSAKIPLEPLLPVACIAHTPKKFGTKRSHRKISKAARKPCSPEDVETKDQVSRNHPIVYSIYDAASRQEKLSLRKSKPYWIKTRITEYLSFATLQNKAEFQRISQVKSITVNKAELLDIEALTKTSVFGTSTREAESTGLTVKAIVHPKSSSTAKHTESSSSGTTAESRTQKLSPLDANVAKSETSRANIMIGLETQEFSFLETNTESHGFSSSKGTTHAESRTQKVTSSKANINSTETSRPEAIISEQSGTQKVSALKISTRNSETSTPKTPAEPKMRSPLKISKKNAESLRTTAGGESGTPKSSTLKTSTKNNETLSSTTVDLTTKTKILSSSKSSAERAKTPSPKATIESETQKLSNLKFGTQFIKTSTPRTANNSGKGKLSPLEDNPKRVGTSSPRTS